MAKIFNSKKTIWIIASILIVIVIGGVSLNMFLNPKAAPNLRRMEYRTDTQPIINRFGEKISIESCFWKSDVFNSGGIGPSSYWMKGFAKISRESFAELKAKYSMTKIEVNFEKGISPDVTGFSSFDWNYSKELSREIAGASFIGEFYLDINNGILYFDLESN